jgi:hypothetical protein
MPSLTTYVIRPEIQTDCPRGNLQFAHATKKRRGQPQPALLCRTDGIGAVVHAPTASAQASIVAQDHSPRVHPRNWVMWGVTPACQLLVCCL